VVNAVTKTVVKSQQFFQMIKYNQVNINVKKTGTAKGGIRLPYAVQRQLFLKNSSGCSTTSSPFSLIF
jgi:hypothetical protein